MPQSGDFAVEWQLRVDNRQLGECKAAANSPTYLKTNSLFPKFQIYISPLI